MIPVYTMTVLDLSKSTGGPTIVTAAAATPSPVTGTTTVRTAEALDQFRMRRSSVGAVGVTLSRTWIAIPGSYPA